MSQPARARAALRVALFGSPAFALPSLEALARHHRLQLVVAQPDKRAGRGLRTSSPVTVQRARELGVGVLQPARLKGNTEFEASLRELELDVAITAAYGKILPASLLQLPRFGFLNVHASLLPSYRGAAPVQWALIRGERETGITIMQTEAGLDTGPIRLQRRLPIEPGVQAPELLEALARLGARALLEALTLLARGELPSQPQQHDRASYAPMLERDDGRVRWSDPADSVLDRYRGVAGWPGSHFLFQGEPVKAVAMAPASAEPHGAEPHRADPHRAGPGAAEPHAAEAGAAEAGAAAPGVAAPGTVLAVDRQGLRVACAVGSVRLVTLQPAGKRAMAARDWANGRSVGPGARLG